AHLTVRGEEGRQELQVTRQLHPQPIVGGVPAAMTVPFSQLRIEREDLGTLDLAFTGDLFELEDQRNWGDASFKTYCTPLRAGFPRTIAKGDAIAHSLDMRFTPANTVSARSEPVAPTPQRQPSLGRVWSATRQDDSAWDHIHIDTSGQEPQDLAATL